MNRLTRCGVVLAGVALVATAGCAPKCTIDDIKAMKPQRPAELDRLNDFAGDWNNEAEMNIPGLDEVLTGQGTSSATWECDGMALVEHATFDVQELGAMTGITVYTWDPRAKVYRVSWFNSWGESGTGTMRYCAAKMTWKMRGKSRSFMGTAVSEWKAKCKDDNTVEWTFTEWDGLGLCKHAEGKGTSKRE